MLGRVPPPLGDVEPADERNRIVDDDDLLVMRRINRVSRIEPERKTAVRAPIELVYRQPFALEGIKHREIPAQSVDAQRLLAPHQRVEKIAELLGQSVTGTVRDENSTAVDVPGDDEDRMPSAREDVAQRAVIRIPVDEEAQSPRALEPPASPRRHEERRGGSIACNYFIHGHGSLPRCKKGAWPKRVGYTRRHDRPSDRAS